MKPKNWLDVALELSRNGDRTAEFCRQMLDEQVKRCMDGMSAETMRKIRFDKLRGVLKETA